MKLQHAEGQRRLLHRLHRERQRLQEQRALWENRLIQSNSERKKTEELHNEEVHRLKDVIQSASQSQAGLEELRRRCCLLEDDLKASHERSSEVEARLETSKQLSSEKSLVEEELHLVKHQVVQLKEKLANIQAASNAVVQQQVQLRERDQTVANLRSELEALQKATRTRAGKLTAELDLLKKDRARLIQDLKDQAMAVDALQLELDRSRSSEEDLQVQVTQLQAKTAEEEEELGRLSQENGSYARLADQLSTQIVEMEEEITTLRDQLRELSSQLNGTADLVLDLRRQLNSKTSQVDQLQDEVVSEKRELESKDAELNRVREQVRNLQQVLQESQSRLRTTKEDFEQEKKKMTRQLMELERLVLALEDVMDPDNSYRFVEHGTDSRTWSEP